MHQIIESERIRHDVRLKGGRYYCWDKDNEDGECMWFRGLVVTKPLFIMKSSELEYFVRFSP